jgi:hypothetical protein
VPRIQPEHIAAARYRVDGYSLQESERLADEVFKAQPNLLSSVLVLSRYAVPAEHIDVALKVLFICYEAVRMANLTMRQITEGDQERCLSWIGGRARFIECLPAETAALAVQGQVGTHPEKYMLALAYGMLAEKGLAGATTEAEKYLLMATLNIAETIARVVNDA